MLWSKPKTIKIGTCMTKVPRKVHIEHHQVVEMVCGECTTASHDVYRFELPLVDATKTNKFWRKNKNHSGDFAIIAKCTICGQARPLDARANQWLYDIKAISQSEYLSWAK
jgi:hypothetical protein